MATTAQYHQRTTTSHGKRDRSESRGARGAFANRRMPTSRYSLIQFGGSQQGRPYQETPGLPISFDPKQSTDETGLGDMTGGFVSKSTSTDAAEAASGGRTINWAPRSEGQFPGHLGEILTLFVSPDFDEGILRGTENRPVEAAGVFLRACGLISFAGRISELSELRSRERRMGSMDSPVAIESLVSATSFFLTGNPLAAPIITLTSDGLLLCRWTLDPSGYIALLFRSDGDITYSVLRPSHKGNGDPYRVRGTECQTSVRNIVDLASQWIRTK